jgi:hypothetical protein
LLLLLAQVEQQTREIRERTATSHTTLLLLLCAEGEEELISLLLLAQASPVALVALAVVALVGILGLGALALALITAMAQMGQEEVLVEAEQVRFMLVRQTKLEHLALAVALVFLALGQAAPAAAALQLGLTLPDLAAGVALAGQQAITGIPVLLGLAAMAGYMVAVVVVGLIPNSIPPHFTAVVELVALALSASSGALVAAIRRTLQTCNFNFN